MDLTPASPPIRVATATRAAGTIYVATAIGFGVGAVISLVYLARHGELPMTPFGFRAFSGPFEGLGTAWFSVLGWVFVGVCAVEALAGWKLWQGERRGATIGIRTTPLAVMFGLGFALPFYLASVPVRLGLLVLGRRNPR